jgi:hypothetical protein
MCSCFPRKDNRVTSLNHLNALFVVSQKVDDVPPRSVRPGVGLTVWCGVSSNW